MNTSMIVAVVVLSCCALARADYLSDRKAAMELPNGGTNEAALALLIKMAEGPYTEFQKSDAWEQAAWCAWRLKRKDQAMELAKRIPLAPASKTLQMRLMDADRNWKGIVDTFKDESIHLWSEDVVCDAYFLRGQAYYRTGNGKGAEADLTQALEYNPNNAMAVNMLGDTYASLLKDDERAMEAYRRGYKSGGHWATDQILGVIRIRVRQNKLDEALAELNAVDADKNLVKGDPHWRRGFMLSTQGYILAKQGKKDEAIAKYREAAQVEGLAPAQKAEYEKTIKALETEPVRK